MLACYLDDSGKDPQNVITTIAGYVASEEAWDKFEEEVAPAFAERNVSVLHAMDLNGTRGEFEGWSVLNKQAFVARIAQAASRHVTMGLSMSALKGTYKEHSRYRGRNRTADRHPLHVLLSGGLRLVVEGYPHRTTRSLRWDQVLSGGGSREQRSGGEGISLRQEALRAGERASLDLLC